MSLGWKEKSLFEISPIIERKKTGGMAMEGADLKSRKNVNGLSLSYN